MNSSFNAKTYGSRNMAETVFFDLLKSLFEETLYSRSYRQQVKEIKLKCINFFIDRFLKITASVQFVMRISTEPKNSYFPQEVVGGIFSGSKLWLIIL